MADLVIESDRMKNSWLQQELMQSCDQHISPAKRQPLVRNLSSAGRGTVRGFQGSGQHQNGEEAVPMATHLQRSLSAEGECPSFPQIAMKGIYNSSKLQELPPGYFSNGDLWLSGSKGDIVRSQSAGDVTSSPFQDKYRSTMSSSMNTGSNSGYSGRVPHGTQTQMRSRSAKQRSLGTPRGDYRHMAASESQIVDVNGWRSMSPEYYQNQSPFLVKVNNYHENNKRPQRFHYFGPTRINLDDPTGLFQQFDQKNNEGISGSKRQNGHIPDSRNNTTENLVLVRTARKHSSVGSKVVRTSGNGKKGKVPSPPNSPFLPPELFIRLHNNTRSIVESTDMLQRFKDSMLYQNGRHSSPAVNGSCGAESSADKVHGLHDRSHHRKNGYNKNHYQHQVLDNFSRNSNRPTQSTEPSKPETANTEADKKHATPSEHRDPYVVDEAVRLTDSFVTKTNSHDKQKKQEQLSFSEFFLVGIENTPNDFDRVNSTGRHSKSGTSRRSVRFKVQDVVHEYEPWAPIQAPC